MRIVAGQYRGRTLCAPRDVATRPTLDRVREALFSSLYSMRGELEGAVVLDAFGGSGALGLEALSRGASHVVFYENDPAAQQAILTNVEALGVSNAVELFCCDILQRPPLMRGRCFDLVLLDPPYKMPVFDVLSLLVRLYTAGALASDVLISYEHAAAELDTLHELVQTSLFCVLSEKKYGKTSVTFLQPQAGMGDATIKEQI